MFRDRGFGEIAILLLGSIYGVVIISMYIVGYLLCPNLTTLNCSRTKSLQSSCELTSSGLFGTYKTQFLPGQIKSAEIDRRQDEDGVTFGLLLIGYASKIPVNGHYENSEDNLQQDVKKINVFLNKSSEKSLIIEKDSRWMIIYPIFPLLFIMGAIARQKQYD